MLMFLPTTIFSKMQAHASSPHHLCTATHPSTGLLPWRHQITPSPQARCWAQLCDPYRDHRLGPAAVLTSVVVVWPCLALSARGCSKEETFFQGLADSVLTAGEQGTASGLGPEGRGVWHEA